MARGLKRLSVEQALLRPKTFEAITVRNLPKGAVGFPVEIVHAYRSWEFLGTQGWIVRFTINAHHLP